MITMESPDERPVKMIIVALWNRHGMIGWRLVAARKVGRSYHVLEGSRDDMINPRMLTPQDIYRSTNDRPLATYREFGASQTISDTGPVPIK